MMLVLLVGATNILAIKASASFDLTCLHFVNDVDAMKSSS